MRSVESKSMNSLRFAAFAVAIFMQAGSAFAGGPLWVVKTNGNAVAPAKWVGTVKLSTDQGPLSTACRLDEFYSCMLDENGNPIVDVLLTNEDGDALVAQAAAQWSGVATSSFRAQVTGTLPQDITGANVGTVIGAWNGGGIQVIYDADGSVISELTGGTGYGVLGIASPEYLAGDGSTQITEGWLVVGGSSFPTANPEPVSGVVTHELGHAINLAHSQVNGYLSINNPAYLGRTGPERAGPDQCGTSTAYPAQEEIETMYPIINPYPNRPDYDSPQMATVDVADDRLPCRRCIRPRTTRRAPARSRAASLRRTGTASSRASTSSHVASTSLLRAPSRAFPATLPRASRARTARSS